QIIAYVLLVEALLIAAGLVLIRRPEAAGIRREDFIDEDDPLLRLSEFKLRIGKYNSAFLRVFGCSAIKSQRLLPQFRHDSTADALRRLLERDVLIVPALFFRGWREDRFGQLVALPKTRRQFDPADRLTGTVFLPAAACQVSAGDALDQNYLGFSADHRS